MVPPRSRLRQVLGSGSIWVLGQVAVPARPATVLHAGPEAIYVLAEDVCLGITAASSVQVPCAVRTSLPHLPDVAPGQEAEIGDGHVAVDDIAAVVSDLVDTTVPVLAPEAAAWAGSALARLTEGRVDRARAVLPHASEGGLLTADPAVAEELLGLGPGLTPLADDVLSGWLAAAVASGHPGLPAMRGAVALSAHERTTPLSATLLACAARGEGIPEFRDLVTAAAGLDAIGLERAASRLLAVGDSSGEGLVLGVQLALGSGTHGD